VIQADKRNLIPLFLEDEEMLLHYNAVFANLQGGSINTSDILQNMLYKIQSLICISCNFDMAKTKTLELLLHIKYSINLHMLSVSKAISVGIPRIISVSLWRNIPAPGP
jgi:hypothetical protein